MRANVHALSRRSLHVCGRARRPDPHLTDEFSLRPGPGATGRTSEATLDVYIEDAELFTDPASAYFGL